MSENEEKKNESGTEQDTFRSEWDVYDATSKKEKENLDPPERSKKEKRKEKASFLFLCLFIFGLAFWNIFTGAKGLFFAKTNDLSEVFQNPKKGEVYTGEISYASTEYVALKHSLNFIPSGTEHFYIIYSDDLSYAIAVRADKKWMDGVGESLFSEVEKKGQGIVRKMEYKVQNNLRELKADLDTYEISLNIDYYLDLQSYMFCWMELITGVVVFIFTFVIGVLLKKLDIKLDGREIQPIKKSNRPIGSLLIILFVAICLMELYLLTMMM